MKKSLFLAVLALVPGFAGAATFELSGVTQMSAGASHVCVVAAGAAKCWGADSEGQLGRGSRGPHRAVAGDVLFLGSGVAMVAAGGAHS